MFEYFFKIVEKVQVYQNLTRTMVTLHEDVSTSRISCSVLLRVRYVSDKCCRENQNTHFMFNNFFRNHVVYEIMWKNMAEPDGPQMTI
jgi:hypothetical protein